MGGGADEFLTRQKLRTLAGESFRHASDDRLNDLEDKAHDLRERDYMPRDQAVKILSGQSRLPYGSPKPKK